MLAAYEWDWQNAEREYRRALQLNPADASARGLFGNCCLSPQRRFDEAFTELTHAVALDPLSLSINSGLAGLLHEREEFDSAIEHQMKTIELDPNFYFAHFNLGRTYSIMGRHEESLKAFERAAALQPTSTYVRCLMAREFALLGKSDDALEILKDVLDRASRGYVPAIGPAMLYFGLGDVDRAFEWMNRMFNQREIWAIWTWSSPFYKPYRDDPRHRRLVDRLKLPGHTGQPA